MESNGIVLIDKKIGNSTTKEEIPLKRIFNTKKVGHLGTLDPFASGLIICGINKGTKTFPLIEDVDKTYVATLKLGQKTSTLDLEGEVIQQKEVKQHSKKEIEDVLNSFLGEIEQIPPMYSAIKVNGTKLYELARQNIQIDIKPRKVNIKEIHLNSFTNDTITFTSKVSKGTYIRTLGEDIATKLNELGHLIYLRRTKVGDFKVENAKSIDNISTSDLIPIKDVLNFIPNYNINNDLYKYVQHGNIVTLKDLDVDKVLFIYNNNALALYTRIPNSFKFKVLQMF